MLAAKSEPSSASLQKATSYNRVHSLQMLLFVPIAALLYHKENVKVTRATVPYFRDKLKILIAPFAFLLCFNTGLNKGGCCSTSRQVQAFCIMNS